MLARYFPGELSLHSFDNAASNATRKRDNWALLEKFTKVRRCGTVGDNQGQRVRRHVAAPGVWWRGRVRGGGASHSVLCLRCVS